MPTLTERAHSTALYWERLYGLAHAVEHAEAQLHFYAKTTFAAEYRAIRDLLKTRAAAVAA